VVVVLLTLTTQQKTQILVEKVVLQAIPGYLTPLAAVFKTPHLFAVELLLLAGAPQQAVLETAFRHLVQETARHLPLLQVNVLETIFKVLLLCRLITITVIPNLHQLQQLMLVQLLWVLVVVQALHLAQDITAIQAGLAED
jgi:hypothetical protein